MNRIRLLPVALVLTFAGMGCGADTDVTTPALTSAEIKFVHANAAVGPVDVYVAGIKVIGGVPFGRSSGKVATTAGRQHVTLRSGGGVVDELDATIAAHEVTAIVFTQDSAQATPVTPDTGLATANTRANVRVVNVAGSNTSPPTLLDVRIRAPDFASDSVPKLGLDTRTSSHGPLMYFDPGSFRFTFVPHGETTVLAEVSFDVAAGEKKAVVLERESNGQYRASVVVEP
jgi:hypothetical protein